MRLDPDYLKSRDKIEREIHVAHMRFMAEMREICQKARTREDINRVLSEFKFTLPERSDP